MRILLAVSRSCSRCAAAGRLALWAAILVVVTGPIWWTFKQIVQRDRPDVPDQIAGYTYPSGHASEIAAVDGCPHRA